MTLYLCKGATKPFSCSVLVIGIIVKCGKSDCEFRQKYAI